jgi:anti-sigma28 factor (negative regulator of flagellin synthesis)
VKSIDMDRISMGLIHQSTPEGVKIKKMTTPDASINQKMTPGLSNLLSLVKNAPQLQDAQNHVQVLKAAIQSDTYRIDMDSLINNFLVAEYEL